MCLDTFLTSFSWYWLRAQTAPRCQLERPRSGRLSMIKFTFAKPFWLGGGFRMVDGALGIQEHQSYYTMHTKILFVRAVVESNCLYNFLLSTSRMYFLLQTQTYSHTVTVHNVCQLILKNSSTTAGLTCHLLIFLQ